MDLIKTCTQFVRPDSLILDCGANIGGYTHTFVQHTPARSIHAFEAIPSLAEKVRQRFQDEPRVTVFAQGLSDHAYREPEMSIYEAWTLEVPGKSPRGPSLGAIAEAGVTFFPVEFTTVDGHLAKYGYWCPEGNHPITACRSVQLSVPFLKLDVDGFEYRVLQGAEDLLRRDRPLVLLEIGYLIADKGDDIHTFLREIYRWGYLLVTQDETVWPDWETAVRQYPYHTTHDVAMLPKERWDAGEIRLID